MNNLPKVLVVMAISLLGTTNAFADWQSDAAHLSSEAGIDTKSAIDSFRNDIDKFKPPQPCIDKDPQTFTLGTPATLSCGGGSGTPAAASPGGGGAAGVEEQKGSGESFGIMN